MNKNAIVTTNNTSFEEVMSINNQIMNQMATALMNQDTMIKKIKEESVKSAVEATSDIVNTLNIQVRGIIKDNEILKNELNDTKEDLKDMKKDYKDLKEVTYVLATDDGKLKELTRLVKYYNFKKYTGSNTSIKYKLFYRAITNECYKHLYNIYQVNTYKRIKIDDFEECIGSVKRWYNNSENIKRVVRKKLQEYINDKHLSIEKEKMVDIFLEKTEGGTNIHATV